MSAWTSAAKYFQDPGVAGFLLDASLKSFVVLGLAAGLAACLRRRSAATRHWLWFLAAASLVCLPLLSLVLPAWQRPAWALSADHSSGNELTLAIRIAPDNRAEAALREAPPSGAVAGQPAGHALPQAPQRMGARFNARWLMAVPLVWLSGALVVLFFTAFGRFRLWMICRRTRPWEGTAWHSLLNELRQELGVARPVALWRSADRLMPMTWGSWRPAIILPSDAEQWPQERQRIVLWHELAHVRRWDCLTQGITRMICALYWFNPLAWLAARQMCVERERACDDLVLNGGARASDYASHLIEIAKSFRHVPRVAAIAMARSSGLEGRITAIVDQTRARRAPRAAGLVFLGMAALVLVATLAAQKLETANNASAESESLRRQQMARLREFSAAKEKQSESLAAQAKEQISAEYQRFFEAAMKGDFQTVTNMYEDFKRRHPQYDYEGSGKKRDESLAVSYWSPVLEICLAYYDVVAGEPKYIQMAVDDVMGSIPAGSIYFGGTDPGRGLPTAFVKSHVDADPFFVLTQNALANDDYLTYLRHTFGGRIYTPTGNDSTNCFDEYKADAQARMQKGQLRPGEDVKVVENKVQVTGQVAVMAVNALLAKIIFDKNPEREFYIEESFPLEWMYPHLEPNGLVLKINRQPLRSVPDDVVRRDQRFWTERVDRMVGPWLKEKTSVQEVADFAEKVYARRDLSGFQGDPRFVQNEYAQKMFSKFRSAIAGVFLWRANQAAVKGDAPEKQRMTQAADHAFRQAYALCPGSPEALYRYVNLLAQERRFDDALALARASSKTGSIMGNLSNLIRELERMKASVNGAAVSPNASANGATVSSDVSASLAKLEAAYRANPDDFSNARALATFYAALGRTNDLLRIADHLAADQNADAPTIAFAAHLFQQTMNYPKLEAALQRWAKLLPTPEVWVDCAAAQAAQGKQNEAIASLAQAFSLNHAWLERNPQAPNVVATLGRDPRFASLKTHAAFVQLLATNK